MPVYEYACKSCGHHLEVSQSFKDEPLTECPVCGGALRKVFGSIGVVLKGSGFYRTDSRASSTPRGDRGDKGTEKAGDKAGDKAKPEAKTEAKSESKPGATSNSSSSSADAKAS